jgi:phosphatidylserine/phosphatidylglycerophosphate/cardiolipin synthase-like enzyme
MPGQSSAEEETQLAAAHTLVQPDDGRTLILNALNAAKTSIDLTIYEINDSQIMSALAAAKARKVPARVIYNWYSFPADMQQRQITPAIQQLTKVGIQCQQAPRTWLPGRIRTSNISVNSRMTNFIKTCRSWH